MTSPVCNVTSQSPFCLSLRNNLFKKKNIFNLISKFLQNLQGVSKKSGISDIMLASVEGPVGTIGYIVGTQQCFL